MRWTRAAALLAIVGVGLIVVGTAIGRGIVVEGAYFTRATGTPAYSGFFHGTGLDLFSPRDGNLWIGAGLVCCLEALVAAALALRVQRGPVAG
jgi:hypothetical protein